MISLASLGYSYSAWTDTIMIEGTVTTSEAHNETAWTRMYDKPDDFTYAFPGSNWATYIIHQPTESEATFYLYADQQHKVGELYIWKDNGHLCVKYNLDYDMSESHLHIATSLDGIPQENGNPIPGQFDYNEIHDPYITEYTYTMPWNQSWNNQELYIAAHAVIWVWGIL